MRLLLGADISGAAVPLARVAGFALLALGLACWLARSQTASALASGMLLYNFDVVLVLGVAGVGSGRTGVLSWLAIAPHAVMAVLSLITRRLRLS